MYSIDAHGTLEKSVKCHTSLNFLGWWQNTGTQPVRGCSCHGTPICLPSLRGKCNLSLACPSGKPSQSPPPAIPSCHPLRKIHSDISHNQPGGPQRHRTLPSSVTCHWMKINLFYPPLWCPGSFKPFRLPYDTHANNLL